MYKGIIKINSVFTETKYILFPFNLKLVSFDFLKNHLLKNGMLICFEVMSQ